MADYLEAYAARFELPVRTGVKVDRLSRKRDRYLVVAGDRRFEADNVVVATATTRGRGFPPFAAELDPGIVQLHSTEYRNPAQLREGGVLVVGAGNSGAEIAFDVSRAHPTWLSGPETGQIPIGLGGFWDRLLTPPVWFLASHVLTVRTPIGRKVRPRALTTAAPLELVQPKDLAAAGVERVPRTVGVHDGFPALEDGRVLDVANVIWCTGFRADFGWIDLPVLGDDGEPMHERGVVEGAPGLYLVGRFFLFAFTSGLIGGVGRDAEYIANAHRGTRAGRRAKEEGMITQELERTREAWDGIADGYDEFVTHTEIWLANEALGRAGLQSGMRFLDVAAGAGGLSLPAARLGAQVLATDISPRMVERLLARARDEGLDVEARVMDGHDLELEDDTFDLSGSQFGVMLFPDLPRALREMARVTRPGGRVLMVVYGAPTQIEFLGFFMGAVQSVVPGFEGLSMEHPPLEFQVADPETLRRRLAEAGLEDVRVETVTERLEFESGQEFWDWVLNGNPIVELVIADLTEEQRAEVRQTLDGMLRERAGQNVRAVISNPINIGIGTKP